MIENTNLGNSGLKVSKLCLGCMNFGEATNEEESIEILISAYENGIYFWDTADRYSNGRSEEILGKAIQQIGNREHFVIATKVRGKTGNGPNDQGLSRKHIINAVDESLKRLKTDYIDLYQMHRPCDDSPVDETLEALDRLVRCGKIHYFGTSTFASWQMAEMELCAKLNNRLSPICEQAPYNILDRRIENDRAGFLKKYKWGLLTWSPLGGGQLTGKYETSQLSNLPIGSRMFRNGKFRERMNNESILISLEFIKLCKEANYNPTQAAIAWLLHQSIVTCPIIGPRTIEHFQTIVPATKLKLSEEFLQKIDVLVPPGTAVADFLTPNVSWQKGRI